MKSSSGSETLRSKRTIRRVLRVFGFGLAITAAASLFARRTDRRQQQIQFEQLAQVSGRHFSNELIAPIEVVHALGSLFEASEQVSEDEFRTFAQPALKRNSGLSALLWMPRIPHAQRARFEARRGAPAPRV